MSYFFVVVDIVLICVSLTDPKTVALAVSGEAARLFPLQSVDSSTL